jgi:ankyrin repeat protein
MKHARDCARALAQGAPALLQTAGVEFVATWEFYFNMLDLQQETHQLHIDWTLELASWQRARQLVAERAKDMEQLLRSGANVNVNDYSTGFTALHCAAALGHIDTTLVLMQHHADTALQCRYSGTALLAAVGGCGREPLRREPSGHAAVCHLLLAGGARLEERDKNGNTALMIAASWGHASVCEVLLTAGAQLEQRSADGRTALVIAASGGHTAVCQLLLAAGARRSPTEHAAGCTAIHYAAINGHVDCVEELLLAGAAPNTRGGPCSRTPLVMAASLNHYAIAELCVAFGADLRSTDASNSTAVDWALDHDNHDMARMLRRCQLCASAVSALFKTAS